MNKLVYKQQLHCNESVSELGKKKAQKKIEKRTALILVQKTHRENILREYSIKFAASADISLVKRILSILFHATKSFYIGLKERTCAVRTVQGITPSLAYTCVFVQTRSCVYS